ncbi:MAG: hypothetical protein ACKOFW_21200, partial [Planctomycetaceae bacterium]
MERVPYTIIIKSVMDFAEPGRGYQYRTYAARAAAEVLLGFLRNNLVPGGRTAGDILLTGQAPLPADPSPAQLLTAKYRAVPWNREVRAVEWERLETWCRDSRPVSLRLFTGLAGSGKTRLFGEWSACLREQGWDAGFLPAVLVENDSTQASDVETLVAEDRPTLIAIDYAERSPHLTVFLKRLLTLAQGRKQPLRIALIAREKAEWYDQLLGADDSLSDAAHGFEPVGLRGAALVGGARVDFFTRAVSALRGHRRQGIPEIVTEIDPERLSDERFERLLYLQMAALATVDGLTWTAEGLLQGIVTHETHFWAKPYRVAEGWTDQQSASFLTGARRVVAAYTLLGGVPSRDVARQVYERVEGPREVDFLAQLGDLYPGSNQPGETNTYLGPLTPDLLGESLVATVLRHRETSRQFVEEVTRGGVENAIQQACTVLGQLGARHEFDPAPWIKQLLEGDFAGRVDPALKAAQALGEETTAAPVGRVLAEVCQRSGSVELAARLEGEIPHQTVSLRELGLWVAETLVAGLDESSTDEPVLAMRAGLLNKLAGRQSQLGHREAA